MENCNWLWFLHSLSLYKFSVANTYNDNGYLLLQFIQDIGSNIFKQNDDTKYIAVKFLILASSFVLELRRTKERVIECGNKVRKNLGSAFPGVVDDLSFIDDVSEKLIDKFLYLLVSSLILFSVIVWRAVYISVILKCY